MIYVRKGGGMAIGRGISGRRNNMYRCPVTEEEAWEIRRANKKEEKVCVVRSQEQGGAIEEFKAEKNGN